MLLSNSSIMRINKFTFLFLFVSFLVIRCSVNAQAIRVLFNQPVDNTISTYTDAVYTPGIEDTIVAILNTAVSSIDVAVWDNGSNAVITALNNAYNRGVTVRYITSSNSLNLALVNLNSNISVLTRQASISTNVMHNKFFLVDQNILMTGSMNLGSGSIHDDYNNWLIIEHTGLVQNYKIEFEEMWGSNSATPNSTNSKFGPAKTDNTQHNFTIGSVPLNSYFSPSDGTTAQIVNIINTADYSLDIAMLTFINNDLGDAVIAAKNRGVAVRAIIENVSYIGSEYQNLLNNGINVLSHAAYPYDFHHKYCIVDANFPTSDPLVVTGSHNWTNSAEEDNDENTLIIHDFLIAQQYLEEFGMRFSELSTAVSPFNEKLDISIFPNPVRDFQMIKLSREAHMIQVNVFSMLNLNVLSGRFINSANINLDMTHLNSGIYLIQIIADNVVYYKKITKI
ncbi:MAG: phospholipase D-like domain-containing protein [Bacteroidales bacterium]|nr:phospholipase D-like domain-containing protein [Bacteroidales bacterium]